MKNKILAFGITALAMIPGLASAAAYGTSTAATDFGNAASDVGYMIAVGTAATLGGLAALTGLGFAVRHFLRWVAGKKF